MAFFNLTMVGYQNIYKELGRSKTCLELPPINNNNSFKSTTSKPLDSNLKYHELRTKHVRSKQGKYIF